MKDIQSETDTRGIPIDHIGICDLWLPLKVRDADDRFVTVQGKLSFYVDLEASIRGTHMSRLVSYAHQLTRATLSVGAIEEVLSGILHSLHAQVASISITWMLFRQKRAPKSGEEGYLNYRCGITAERTLGQTHITLMAGAPVMSLCPCSLAISKIGAHNQRSQVTLDIIPKQGEWHGNFLSLIERHGSSDLYSILKRSDEKHVVDHAFLHPKFAEDMVRDIAGELKTNAYEAFLITCKNYESIHNHNVFAQIGHRTDSLIRKDT